jgi:hypothetical protein
MKDISLPALNVLITLATLYLFKVYGSLSTWWRRLFREVAELQIRGSNFHETADQIHVIAIVILSLNLTSAIMLLNATQPSKGFSITAVICAALGLALCLSISI